MKLPRTITIEFKYESLTKKVIFKDQEKIKHLFEEVTFLGFLNEEYTGVVESGDNGIPL